MTYLVDADVLIEPTRPSPSAEVVAWLRANEQDLVVDAIILGELRLGVLALPRGRKRTRLEDWFESVAATVECLPWDAAVARRWAALVSDLKRAARPVPLLDSMIAATALHHGLTIATRNTRDFASTGAMTLDPFL